MAPAPLNSLPCNAASWSAADAAGNGLIASCRTCSRTCLQQGHPPACIRIQVRRHNSAPGPRRTIDDRITVSPQQHPQCIIKGLIHDIQGNAPGQLLAHHVDINVGISGNFFKQHHERNVALPDGEPVLITLNSPTGQNCSVNFSLKKKRSPYTSYKLSIHGNLVGNYTGSTFHPKNPNNFLTGHLSFINTPRINIMNFHMMKLQTIRQVKNG